VTAELLRAIVDTEQDVFTVRRQGRQLAAALGLEGLDEIRVAAALSEVGRRLLATLGRTTVVASVEGDDESDHRELVFRSGAAGTVDDVFVSAIRATQGLMDRWEIERNDRETTVTMARWLPDRVASLTAKEIQAITADVAGLTAGTPLDELAEHNRQLMATLQEVQRHRDELLRINAELEETNRGVVALYSELSQELEATNRGVVALYAELDQRTTQLRAASDAKTRFLANVSHELRSPVTSIVGLARLMRDPSSAPLTGEQGEQLALIDSSARSLLGLVNQLLDLAKAESGRLQPTRQDTDLREIFSTLRGTLRAFGHDERTTLVVAEPEVPTLYTDPIMLTQVLRNLITNGLKFTPSGEVRVTASYDQDAGTVSMSVTDTGIGIPADEHERIFEEFHQVRNGLRLNVAGTGLGLPYARRLVHLLGGALSLTSTPGQGSTFTVILPVGLTGPPTTGASLTFLVVDDDDAFRMTTTTALRESGARVDEATNGAAALAAIDTRVPDLILLDLRMATMDGRALLEALEADPELRSIPVVVLTAYPGDLANEPAARRAAAVLDKAETTLDQLPALLRGLAIRR
jgi:signal transduction histidine kinase